MQDREHRDFLGIMTAMGAAFRAEMTEPLLSGYWLALQDLSLADFRSAAQKALRTSDRMPVPSKLRELAGDSGQLAALDAWTAVIGAIRAHGSWHSVDFGPVINATVRALGGWRQLCLSDRDQLHNFTRREFERVFGAMSTRPVEHLQGQPLMGQNDETPRKIQVGPAKPKQINGTPRKSLPPVERE
jgi:hypothetical protein